VKKELLSKDRHLDKKRMKDKKEVKRDKKKSLSDDSENEENDTERNKNKGGKDRNIKKKSGASNHRKALLPERYDLTTPLTIFLTQLESCAKYNGWSTEDKATHLRVSPKGNSSYIIDDETFEDATFDQLVTRLKCRFGTEGQSSLYQSKLRVRRRGKDESLQALYHDIIRMAGLAFPGKSSIHRELAETEAFIEAITERNLRMKNRDKEPKDLDHALRIALLAEANTVERVIVETVEAPVKAKKYRARSAQSFDEVTIAAVTNEQSVRENIEQKCAKMCDMLEIFVNKCGGAASAAV